jgi:DNA polymerase III epsilon subunit-like protein
MDMLLPAPTLSGILNHLEEIMKQKRVVIYNADFDIRLLNQTVYQDNIHIPEGKLITN